MPKIHVAQTRQEQCSRTLESSQPVLNPALPYTHPPCEVHCLLSDSNRSSSFLPHSRLIISSHPKVDNPYTEVQAAPNILSQLCFTWHLHKPCSSSNSVQEVPIAIEELSPPLDYFAAEVLITQLLCLQIFQFVTWQSTTISSSLARTVTGGVLLQLSLMTQGCCNRHGALLLQDLDSFIPSLLSPWCICTASV